MEKAFGLIQIYTCCLRRRAKHQQHKTACTSVEYAWPHTDILVYAAKHVETYPEAPNHMYCCNMHQAFVCTHAKV